MRVKANPKQDYLSMIEKAGFTNKIKVKR